MEAVNLNCPWSGDAVQPDALTTYKGHTVGFCNPGCRDKFDKAKNSFDVAIDDKVDESAFKTSLIRLAAYNRSFNHQLFEAVWSIPDALYRRNLGAFFGSIHGTLNHILVWDITWLQRFALHRDGFVSLAPVMKWVRPTAHNETVCDDLESLRSKRIEMDAMIEAFIQETSEADYTSKFRYVISTGKAFHRNFGGMLQHLFNHQTHHRGQVTTLLAQNGCDPGVTDLLATLPELTPQDGI
ncbi:MAG: DinB family protein [Pseudomonadota bacterium]